MSLIVHWTQKNKELIDQKIRWTKIQPGVWRDTGWKTQKSKGM